MKIMPPLSPLLAALIALVGLSACEEYYTVTIEDDPQTSEVEDDGRLFLGAYVGEDCAIDSDCRDGLVCDNDKCIGSESKQANAKCLLTVECDGSSNPPSAPHGLHCGWAGFCVKSCVGCPWCGDGICNGEETNASCGADCGVGESGDQCEDLSGTTADISLGAATGQSCSADAGQEGSDCSTSSECARELFCDMQGLSGFCTRPEVPAGKGDIGDTCESTKECYLGLRCSELSGTCVPGSILLYPDLFGGEECSGTQRTEAMMPFGVRMAIPGEAYAIAGQSCADDGECESGVCCGDESERAGTCAKSAECDMPAEISERLDFFSFPFPNDGLHTFHEDVACGDDAFEAAAPLACDLDVECGAERICCEGEGERAGTCAEESACDLPFEAVEEDALDECPWDDQLRAREGTLNYRGFPLPGNGLIGFDPVGATVLALDGEMRGWSLLQAVTLRFTHPVDEATLSDNLKLVNLESGMVHPAVVKSEPIRNKFSCANRVFVQPLLSHPLEPNVPYAVIVTTGVRALSSEEGVAGAQAQALEGTPMLLGSSEPAAGVAREIWQSFQPLRDMAGQANVPALSDIAGATVFTPGNPSAVIEEIRELVDTRAVPEISWAVKCEGPDTPTRCATPGYSGEGPDPRGCQEQSSLYTEYHTQVEIPVLQTGTRPYISADPDNPRSGDLNYVDGTLTSTATEKVCVAISVPNKCDLQGCQPGVPALDTDWPVLIYGHGTGGTHRQGIALLGSELSSPVEITTAASAGNGELKERFMVVAWDQPMHHLRRFPAEAVEDLNASTYALTPDYVEEYTKEPGPLFYNFQNPRAARANYLQAVADTFSLVKVLSQGTITVAGDTHGIDTTRLSYHGHSQGGGNGPMVAPFEPGLDLMLLSGTGGGTVDGILGKKLPYDSSIGCRIMLQEIDVSRSHPGIQVLQHYFDAIDPGIYAPLLTKRAINFMEVVGVRDSFTPPVSMAAYARGADLDLLTPASGLPVWFDALEEGQDAYIQTKPERLVSGEIGANRDIDGEMVTHVSVQHPPCANDAVCTSGVPVLPSFDGHFVVYQNSDSLKEALSFLYSWAETGEAVVTPYGSNTN